MDTNFDFAERLINLYEKISAEEVDALLITKVPNVTYFSGFRGDSSALLIGKNIRKLITDARYIEQARREAKNFQIVKQEEGIHKKISEELKASGCKKVGFEGLVMTVAQHDYLIKNAEGVELKSVALDNLRQVKDAAEISCIKKACEIADKAFEKILDFIKPDVSEVEVAAELEYFMRKFGSERAAFTTIVVSGWRGSLPHGTATDKKICAGELVTMDFGATFNGYHSDITRTICVGRASGEQKKIYNAVLSAQVYGLEVITARKGGKDIDATVRKSIEDAGYGKYFDHGLGHGVGLEIHEEPRLSKLSKCESLLPNMIVTDEPGIYIENFGGVRIEDTVLVTNGAAQPLTHSPKNLIEL